MSQNPNPVMAARRRNHGPQIGVRLMETGRPSMAAELTADDREAFDDAEWHDLCDWWIRRTTAGAYRLGEFSPREFIARMSWLRQYTIRLRVALRDSKSVAYRNELETENRKLRARLLQLERAPDTDRVRRLRAHTHRLEDEMRRWGLAVPQYREWDG